MTSTTTDQVPQRPWLEAYAPDVPADIAEPDRSLSQLLIDAVAQYGEREALDFLGAGTSFTRLGELVDRAAEGLRRSGVRAGDRVALVLPNCPQHVVAFYAVLRLGAVVVEHNPLYTSDELAVQFADHGATTAVVWSKVAETIVALGVPQVLSVDLSAALPRARRLLLRLPVPAARAAAAQLGPRRPPAGTTSWEALVAASERIADTVPAPGVHDTALIQYTGGTTGVPKGAVLTHRNLMANAMMGRAWTPTLKDGEETVLAVLPFFHAYGLTLCLTFSVLLGARMSMLPRFEIEQALETIARVRPTFLPGVPPIYERIAAEAPSHGVDLTSLRIGLSGAMALPAELVERWEELTGGLLVEGYGMTETAPITVGNPISTARRPGTVGVPFPSTYVRLRDPDDPEREVEPGDPGELHVQGPQVFSGYWGRPDETAQVLLPGGWIRTGDIVLQDDDGYLRVVDRLKEIIITGGFNVYPTEVEEVLRRHPAVADAAVVGLPSGHQGEQVAAAVVLAAGATITGDELRRFCRQHLAGYKTPHRVDLVDELPRTLIGKVLRRRLREQLLAAGRD